LQIKKYHRDNFSCLQEYLGAFQKYFNELFAIECPLEDKKKCLFALNGLYDQYDSFITSMLKPPMLVFSNLISQLQSFEIWLTDKSSHVIQHGTTLFDQRSNFKSSKKEKQFHHSNNNYFSSHGRGFSHNGPIMKIIGLILCICIHKVTSHNSIKARPRSL